MQTPNSLILCIDNDSPTHLFLKAALVSNGYDYLKASSGEEGLKKAVNRNPELILLELGLPDLDGLEVTRRLRTWWKKPIIVISARSREKEKLEAFEAGVDDYLTKPFGVAELLARIRAALRRTQFSLEAEKGRVFKKYGDLKVDFVHRRVWRGKKEIYLTRREYPLFATLALNAGEVVTFRNLLNEIWGEAFLNQGLHRFMHINLRVLITRLRQKLESETARPIHFQNHKGVGYRLKID